jgi:hypothetical protein
MRSWRTWPDFISLLLAANQRKVRATPATSGTRCGNGWKFSLSLHPEKTRLIEFGRHAAANRKRRGLGKPETFNFLGFTLIVGNRFGESSSSTGVLAAIV